MLVPALLSPTGLTAAAAATDVAAPAAAAGTPSPRGAAAPDPADPAGPVSVEVTDLLPRAPASPEEPLQVTGVVVNRGTEPVEDLEVRLAVGAVLRSRSALALAEEDRRPAVPRGPEASLGLDRLAPGSSTSFDLRMPVGALGLTRLGVYPLQVVAAGRLGAGRRSTEVGVASTFVPWFPTGPPAPSRLAFLWPLVDEPARAPDDAFLDAALPASLAPSSPGGDAGRLAALLEAARTGAPGACDPEPAAPPGTAPGESDEVDPAPCRRDPVPLTFAVDPALVEAVAALAGEHAVRTDDGARPAPPSADAARWLTELRDAVAGAPPAPGRPALPGGDLLALPYADPDVVAVSRQRSGLSDDVEQLRLLGRRVAADLVGVEPTDDLVWPSAGRLSSGALDAVLGGGARAVVLDEQALPPLRFDLPRTPGARTELSSASAGRVTGLVVDDGLSRLLAASPEEPTWQGARLAEQRWLAETAILAAERPGESRTFVVAPPRRGSVVPEVAAAALHDAGRLPWLCPVPLSDVVDGTERCPRTPPVDDAEPVSEERGDLAPAEGEQRNGTGAETGELPAAYLEEVAEVRARGNQLTDEVLVAGSDAAAEVKARFLRARGRAESSAWRGDPAGGRQMLTLLRDDVDAYRAQVRLDTSGEVVFTADTGVIDVSITNALDQPVTLAVQLNDPIEARLTSTDTELRTIGPSAVVPVRLRVEARTGGQFVVRATLLDRAGQPFGEPEELIVRSTGFGRLALAITGIGAGVLLVAAGVRIVRRALRRPAVGLGPEDDA